MKTPLLVFVKALGFYCLVTMPAMFFPPMYLMSVMFMLMYAGIAGIIFALLFYALQSSQYSLRGKMIALYIAVVPSVALAFQTMETCGSFPGVWQSEGFMLFPLAAVIAGWISLYQSRKLITEQFKLHVKLQSLQNGN